MSKYPVGNTDIQVRPTVFELPTLSNSRSQEPSSHRNLELRVTHWITNDDSRDQQIESMSCEVLISRIAKQNYIHSKGDTYSKTKKSIGPRSKPQPHSICRYVHPTPEPILRRDYILHDQTSGCSFASISSKSNLAMFQSGMMRKVL